MSEKVDVSKLREGDVVLVRGKVRDMGKAGPLISVDILNHDPSGAFHHSRVEIVSVEPRLLKVGDRVNAGHITGAAILCIDGQSAWIVEDGYHYTVNLKALERAS